MPRGATEVWGAATRERKRHETGESLLEDNSRESFLTGRTGNLNM